MKSHIWQVYRRDLVGIHQYAKSYQNTVEPQWLEHLWHHGNSFETSVVRATEG